jgi:hypothetical protein
VNRLILKYGKPIAVVVLAVFAWVVYQRVANGTAAVLAVTAGAGWLLGTVTFVSCWPRITVNGLRRAITRRGLGDGPIPVNALRAAADTASGANGTVLATGTDDLVYLAGWLDVRKGPRVLHIPAMHDRYHSIQFTDPVTGANFAYTGTRTTPDTPAGYLLCAPGWTGTPPPGTTRITIPHRRALLIGRVHATDPDDRRTAYTQAQQIRLTAPTR